MTRNLSMTGEFWGKFPAEEKVKCHLRQNTIYSVVYKLHGTFMSKVETSH